MNGVRDRIFVSDRAQVNLDLHAAIAAAIRDRDVRAAEKTMAYHFDSAIKTLIDAGVV